MDHFITLRFSASELGALNRYRMYLKVIHRSDIVSADGTEILEEYKIGDSLKCRRSCLQWPNQAKPPATAWKLWRNALHHFENGTKLLIPLQQWRYPSHQQWQWFISGDRTKLYKQVSPDQWEAYQIQRVFPQVRTRHSARCYRRCRVATLLTEIPADSRVLITITMEEDQCFACHMGPPLVESTVNKILMTDYVASLLSGEVIDRIQEIRYCVQINNYFYGSVVASESEGGYGFGLSIHATKEICSNSGKLTGRLNMNNGTAVLTGLAGLVYVLSLVERHSKGSLMVHIPYKSVIQELMHECPLGIKQVLKENSDLV
jgi:hypothetical protein